MSIVTLPHWMSIHSIHTHGMLKMANGDLELGYRVLVNEVPCCPRIK